MTPLYGDRLGTGAWVDGYVVVSHSAAGVSADVYLARDGRGGEVALKVLKRALVVDAVALRRFADEARCLAAVRHPSMVQLLGAGDLSDGRPWLALEWLEGQTAAELLVREGAQPTERVVAVLCAVASALQALHAQGFVHRDVSTHNVMWCTTGRVVLLDFGVARSFARSSHLTSTGHLLGTPLALAPEVLSGGAASPASDLYAVGVLGWTLLHAQPPFRGGTLFELTQLHVAGVLPPWLRSDAVALEPLLRSCLSPAPEARPASAALLLERLEALRSPSGSATHDVVVGVYLRAHGDALDPAAFDEWDGEVREAARRWGLVTAADGAALLLVRQVSDLGEARVWQTQLEAWVAEVHQRAPSGLVVEARVTITTGDEALHPERWA